MSHAYCLGPQNKHLPDAVGLHAQIRQKRRQA